MSHAGGSGRFGGGGGLGAGGEIFVQRDALRSSWAAPSDWRRRRRRRRYGRSRGNGLSSATAARRLSARRRGRGYHPLAARPRPPGGRCLSPAGGATVRSAAHAERGQGAGAGRTASGSGWVVATNAQSCLEASQACPIGSGSDQVGADLARYGKGREATDEEVASERPLGRRHPDPLADAARSPWQPTFLNNLRQEHRCVP